MTRDRAVRHKDEARAAVNPPRPDVIVRVLPGNSVVHDGIPYGEGEESDTFTCNGHVAFELLGLGHVEIRGVAS